jgi:hypothetical protein
MIGILVSPPQTSLKRHVSPKGILQQFRCNTSGNVGMLFVCSLPVLLGAVYVAIELSQLNQSKNKLQGIADTAAIAAAREMRLGNATKEAILAVAQSIVNAQQTAINATISFEGDVPEDKRWISVKLAATAPNSFSHALGLADTSLTAKATAKVMGGATVCAVGLHEAQDGTISLDKYAKMEARNCAVYSNSRTAGSIKAQDNAVLSAALICAAGGKGGGVTNFSPSPTTDCPILPDPLASRPPPTVSACEASKTNVKISEQTTSLTPGVYCGGITITKASTVTLSPGIYIIKDGKLKVDFASSLKGEGVGFYFTGVDAGLDMAKESSISLTAPKTGPLAGIIMFQDRNMADDVKYEINNNNAAVLLGTIYLPKGTLLVQGEKPVAQNSAYTIVVARIIKLSAGPTMVLNSNYGLTDVPVPEGLGNLSNKVSLQR